MDTSLFVLIFIPIIGGTLSGLVSMGTSKKSFRLWYDKIKKAPWNPPSWVFGPVWTILYGMMGYASYRVFSSDAKDRIAALITYFIQLAVNLTWSPVFFRLRKFKTAMYIIVTLWALICATIYLFFVVDTIAGWLILPYLLWVTYAATLNWYIQAHNESN